MYKCLNISLNKSFLLVILFLMILLTNGYVVMINISTKYSRNSEKKNNIILRKYFNVLYPTYHTNMCQMIKIILKSLIILLLVQNFITFTQIKKKLLICT